MLNGEATNAIFIVFGLTQPGLEQMIYRTRDEHAYQWQYNGHKNNQWSTKHCTEHNGWSNTNPSDDDVSFVLDQHG
jgi:hypothetical protein